MHQRIAGYGVTGSGKTTLAAQIAARTGLPWHAMDDLRWTPGWVPVPHDEQRRRFAAVCAGERWILDTMDRATVHGPDPRVQLIVGLDYPRWLSLTRLVRRSVYRCVTRVPVCNGNVETLPLLLARDSIIRWRFRSFAGKRAQIRRWAADPDYPPVVRLTSPRMTRRWLSTLPTWSP